MRTPLLAAALAAALAVGGCGGTDDAAESGLLDFDARAVDGSVVDVATLAGADLAIWFWAPW